MFLIVGLITFAILIAVAIAFLMTLSNTLKAISPANRTTEPSSVWLMLIPIFNIVWQFILYGKMKESVNAEYKSKGVSDTFDATYQIGIISAVGGIVSVLYSTLISSTDIIYNLISLALLVIVIMFWVQVSNHKKRLLSLPSTGDSAIFGSDPI